MSEFLIWSAQYHNEPTFKDLETFQLTIFGIFDFIRFSDVIFWPPKPGWSFFMDCKIVTNSEINLGGRTVSKCAPTDVRAETRSHILKSTFIPHRDKLWSKITFSSLYNTWSDFSNFGPLFLDQNRFWNWHHVLQKMPTSEKTKDNFQKKLFSTLQCIYLTN